MLVEVEMLGQGSQGHCKAQIIKVQHSQCKSLAREVIFRDTNVWPVRCIISHVDLGSEEMQKIGVISNLWGSPEYHEMSRGFGDTSS